METLLYVGASNTLLAAGLALLAALVGVVTRRPALAHGLWLLFLLKLVTPPFVHFPVLPAPKAPVLDSAAAPEKPAEGETTVWLASEELLRIMQESKPEGEDAAVPAAALESPVEPAPVSAAEAATDWRSALVVLWLAGSVGWFGLAAYRVARFRRLLRHARAVPPETVAMVNRLASQLGLRRCPAVRFVDGAVSPMVWSIGGPPLLLLPAALWERLTEEQRQTLAAHELAHLARRDHWVRGLELLATGLYWWNPVVWLARHGLREAEERCCDAWVVWVLPSAARAYATALVETVDFLSEARPEMPATASGIGHVRIMKRRLTMILQGTTPRALSATGFLALAALAALALPLLPTWAQEPPSPPVKKPAVAEKVWLDFEVAKPEPREDQVREMLLRILSAQKAGDGDEDVDRVIAELRKKLAELEAKRAREKGKSSAEDKKKTEEIQKAHAEVRKLAEEAQKKEAEAAAARAKLHAAMERLAQMEGGKKIFIRARIEGLDKPNVIYRVQPPAAAIKVPGPIKVWNVKEAKSLSSEDRLQRLEKQLGELLREVKELQREKKKPGEPRGAADPLKPGRVVTVPAATVVGPRR